MFDLETEIRKANEACRIAFGLPVQRQFSDAAILRTQAEIIEARDLLDSRNCYIPLPSEEEAR